MESESPWVCNATISPRLFLFFALLIKSLPCLITISISSFSYSTRRTEASVVVTNLCAHALINLFFILPSTRLSDLNFITFNLWLSSTNVVMGANDKTAEWFYMLLLFWHEKSWSPCLFTCLSVDCRSAVGVGAHTMFPFPDFCVCLTCLVMSVMTTHTDGCLYQAAGNQAAQLRQTMTTMVTERHRSIARKRTRETPIENYQLFRNWRAFHLLPQLYLHLLLIVEQRVLKTEKKRNVE